jgi:hypothetical protein
VQVPVVKHEVRFLSDVKTLVTVNDEELRIAALADINVVQGDPTQFVVEMPEGYEVTGVSGATVDSSEIEKGKLVVHLNSSAPRNHEFLISMERPLNGTKADAPFLSFKDTQRETGEVLVEGTGAMELTATEGGGLKRMDLKEVNPYLRSLARFPLQAAFRYHRQPTEAPTLALEWTRFPDSNVLAAVAEHALVTTLVTVEGRTLTEVKLTVKNQAQPFLKVNLPQGATIVSADVAGEKVKPVQGPDGNRVPLLRPGFRPNGPYEVSFVFMNSSSPFAKKGGSELVLPSMDVPISLLEWELFLPEQYRVKDFAGDAIAANLVPPAMVESAGQTIAGGFINTNGSFGVKKESGLRPGQMGGYVVDPQGAVISGAQVQITSLENGSTTTTRTNSTGGWVVAPGMPSGQLKIVASAMGFKTLQTITRYDSSRPSIFNIRMMIGDVSTTVEVTDATPLIETTQSEVTKTFSGVTLQTFAGVQENTGLDNLALVVPGVTPGRKDRDEKKVEGFAQNGASQNVLNLQKRVAGVLPVRVDVPRAGNSYRFARALVLDEETKVSFNYRTK